jgi:hypothetical protein
VNEVGTEQGLVAGNDDGFMIRLTNLQSDGGQLHNNEIKKIHQSSGTCFTHARSNWIECSKTSIKSQMRIPLKNACETSRCLVVDRWSNNESNSVIVLIVAVISLVVDDHVV